MKVVYYAFDGKDFDNEYECQEYELKQMRSNLGVKMFDEKGNDEEELEKAFFVYVPNTESWEKLADYAECMGFAYPSKEELWEYEESICGQWTPIEKHINSLKFELEKLESIKRKCEVEK